MITKREKEGPIRINIIDTEEAGAEASLMTTHVKNAARRSMILIEERRNTEKGRHLQVAGHAHLAHRRLPPQAIELMFFKSN